MNNNQTATSPTTTLMPEVTHRPRAVPHRKRVEPPFVVSEHPPLGQVTPFFTTQEALAAAMGDEVRRRATLLALAEWVDRDVLGEADSISAGQLYYEFLKLPITTQEEFTHALALSQGVAAPVYNKGKGRTSKGRTELAQALYGRYPQFLAPVGKNKDSLAGKRVSDAIRAYKAKAGIVTAKKAKATVEGVPVSQLKRVINLLYAHAKFDTEVDIIYTLLDRCGVSEEVVTGWLPEESEATPVAA